MKEPEIKLFGRKIVLLEKGGAAGEFSDESGGDGGGDCYGFSKVSREEDKEKEDDEVKLEQVMTQEDKAAEESQNTNAISDSYNNPKTPSIDEETFSEDHPNNEQSEATNPQQKTLKRPDKILPCPRCNSMDTKFCYYNNYNVNQPRHFCKNCQRYWTAGGTIRNVPVGAGRRKNKNSTSHCRHITISEALHASSFDSTFKPNGTVLSFGPDSCQDPAPKRVPNGVINQKNGDDSVTTSNSTEDGPKNGIQEPMMQYINGFQNAVPWPIPWNSAVPVPTIYPSAWPSPVYPTPYWNCGVPNPWNVQFLSLPSQNAIGSNPISPLGKHSRNGELVIPKTLRIDDPEEAAKSSIWSTLGIKNDCVSRQGLFKALQPKGDEKKTIVTASSALQANPAALSRSIRFQERV
ncbi:hypothetical protein ACJIZ3_003347 [Penstemon smallii]|uniref:Dof-type domain-containing protein n=1 Tax=Penstemon smallii TaxID=265156 RepID=A0ABD3U8Z8_9LAMI